jgi:hypothetical protein
MTPKQTAQAAGIVRGRQAHDRIVVPVGQLKKTQFAQQHNATMDLRGKSHRFAVSPFELTSNRKHKGAICEATLDLPQNESPRRD